ncbi:MAG: trigger factor [Patescibacteria group bacterium]
MQTKKEKRPDGEVAVTGVLPAELVLKERSGAIARIQKVMELPGFRRGKVPEERVVKEVGERAIWREAAEATLKKEADAMLKEHGIVPIIPIGLILKPAEAGVDAPFEIIAIVAPVCSIDGYKEAVAKATAKLPAQDLEKEKVSALEALRNQARDMAKSTAEGPVTDDEAKKLGLENAAAAELFLMEEATRAVTHRDLQRKRGAIAEGIIANGKCEIPRLFIIEEARNLLEATKKDLARQDVPWNEYLKRTGKTEEAVVKELEMPAGKRVALDVIFGEIARVEKLEPDQKDEERLAHALMSQGVEHDVAHRYVRATALREKVWELLGAKSAGGVS